jgi:hypothetical protein
MMGLPRPALSFSFSGADRQVARTSVRAILLYGTGKNRANPLD